MSTRHQQGIEKIAVAQIGARRHYAVPRALQSAGNLGRLYTDYYWPDRFEYSTLVPCAGRFIKRLSGRRANGVTSERVSHFPGFYLHRLLQCSMARGREGELRQWLRQNSEFGRLVCAIDFEASADALYAFNGASLEMFEHAREHGLITVLDQTTPALIFEESVVAAESRNWIGWEAPRPESPRLEEILDHSIRREHSEWRLADRIICGSQFAADTITDVPADRIRVVAYPSPVSTSATRPDPPCSHDGPLRVLFAGTLGLRKGLPWLMEAIAACGEAAELRLVGPSQLLPEKLSELAALTDIRGAVPRTEMEEHYRWADVVVLPSLSEGSANVCHEAMAATRAVITTPNSGSVVRDGVDGRVVPAGDSAAIASALQQLIDSRALIAEWGGNAFDRSSCFTFDRYTKNLIDAIQGAREVAPVGNADHTVASLVGAALS